MTPDEQQQLADIRTFAVKLADRLMAVSLRLDALMVVVGAHGISLAEVDAVYAQLEAEEAARLRSGLSDALRSELQRLQLQILQGHEGTKQ